jgi:predicted Zn-dependent peptidase
MRESTELIEGVRETVLDSGVRVVTEAMAGVRSVTIGYWIGVGSRDERDEVAGASHFLEHTLFKGTQRRTAAEIAEALDAVGGDMNAFTSKEYTCFYAQCLDRDTPLAVDVLGDMIIAARNREEDVEQEREVVLEEIRMHLDTPDDLVHSVFSEALYGRHPLAREVLGSEQSILGITREQIHGYYRRHYVPENLTVVASGHVEHDAVVDDVAKALAALPAAGGPTVHRDGPAGATGAQVVLRERPTEQSHIVLGGLGLARGDRRRFSASVLNQALGGGMASRLFQEVREQRGLAYSVYSYQGMHTDNGAFAVYAGTAPRKVETTIDVLRTELDKAAREGITDAELTRAKGNLAGSMLLALEDTGSRMGRLGKAIATDAELLTLDQTLAAVEAVTADDVREVAAALLGGPFTLAVVGPVGDLDAAALQRHCEAA